MRANYVFLPAVIYCFQSHFWKLLFWNFPDLNTVPSKLRVHFFRCGRAEKCAVLMPKKFVGKPFDWILVKTKKSHCGATSYIVAVAIEIEPVNAVS